MRSYFQYLIASGLLLALISAVNGDEVLANSSYPCVGGNAQRTYKINRNTNGRSTVLNVAWIWPPDGFTFDFSTTEITTDAEGHIYVQGQSDTGFIIYRVYFENGTLSTTDSGYTPATPLNPPASLTHVASGYTYMATSTYSVYLEEATMSAIAMVPNALVAVTKPASYVPFGEYMLRSNVGLTNPFSDNLLNYWDTTTKEFFDGPNFQLGRPIDVVIGFNATSEFFIVVSDRSPAAEYPVFAEDQPKINFLPSPPVRAWFEDETLFVVGTEDLLVYYWYNASASVAYSLVGGIDSRTDQAPTGNYMMIHEGKTFAHYYYNATRAEFVDRLGFDYITQTPAPYFQWPPIAQPIFSKPDNIVFYPKGISGSKVYFEGRQWGTWEVKLTGRLPAGVVLGTNFNVTGVPVYGDNCDIAIVHDNKLYGLRPLPIQNVVPIFECYNPNTGIAFFSYNNLEQKSFVIPLTQDRNSFTPYSTPIEDFDVGRGPIYPLSVQFDVGKNIQGYHFWALESYTVPIPFGDNSIICPTTINVIIKLRADGQFPDAFGQIVRSKFVSVTGISDARVTLVAKKRSTHQGDSTLETELAVSPDENNKEEQPDEVIQNFVSNQQETFTQQVNTDVSAPKNVTIDSVSGKELPGQIVGVKDYKPTVPVSSNSPTGQATPRATSDATKILWSRFGLVIVSVSLLYFIY